MDRLNVNPQLRNEILQFCLGQISPDKSLTFTFLRATDDILSIDEDHRSLLSPLEIFDNSLLGLAEDILIESIDLNGFFEVRFLSSVFASPPKRKGDISRGGVFIRASEKNVEIGQYLFTLVCSNGLLGETRRIKRKVYTEEDCRKTLNSVKESTRAVFSEVKEKFLPAFMHSAEVQVNQPSQLIHRLARESKLSRDVEFTVLDKTPSLPREPSYYDVINLVTAIAREEADASLMKLAGKILQESSRYACSHCYRSLK